MVLGSLFGRTTTAKASASSSASLKSAGRSTSSSSKLLIDVHSHVVPPRLVSRLRERTEAPCLVPLSDGRGAGSLAPFVASHADVDGSEVLSWGSEPWQRALLGPAGLSRAHKLSFMDRHRIDGSVLSVASPWLSSSSTLGPDEAREVADGINEDLEVFCRGALSEEGATGDEPASAFSAGDARSNFKPALSPGRRLHAFASLPLVAGTTAETLRSSVELVDGSERLVGLTLGTRGLGRGLDDPALEPLWEAAAGSGVTLFVHPQLDVCSKGDARGSNGPDQRRALLSRAIDMPAQTAHSIASLILSGVLDRHPSLRLLLANAGGVLPCLSSRLAACIAHDPSSARALAHDARAYIGMMWYDAVAYGPEELDFLSRLIGRSLRFKRGKLGVSGTPRQGSEEEKEEVREGAQRILFGSGHPSLPPLPHETSESSLEQQPWRSVQDSLGAVNHTPCWDVGMRARVRGGNALSLLGIQI